MKIETRVTIGDTVLRRVEVVPDVDLLRDGLAQSAFVTVMDKHTSEFLYELECEVLRKMRA